MVNRTTRNDALAALAVAALLVVLAWIVARALATDFQPDSRALTLLRELAQYDQHRDIQANRLASDLSSPPQRIGTRELAASRVLRELENDTGSGVAADLPRLKQVIDAKDQAYEEFRAAHISSVVALDAADNALERLGTAANGPRVRAHDAGATLTALLDRIRQGLRETDIERAPDALLQLDRRAAGLVPSSVAVDPVLGETARTANAAVDGYVAARSAESDAWRRFTYASAGARIQLAARTLERRIESAIDEREVWRVYLVTYAAALAVGLGYLFFHMRTSMRALQGSHARAAEENSRRAEELESAQTRLQETQSRLVNMGRYSSIGRLTAGISQEIGMPLARARGHLSSIRSALPDLRGAQRAAERLVTLLRATDSDHREIDRAVSELATHVEQLRESNAIDALDALAWGGMQEVENFAEMMAQLRGLARPDGGGIASFNVNDAVQAALLIAKPLLRKATVHKELADVPTIECRPEEINQLVLSLIARAAQATTGQLTVSTTREGDDVMIGLRYEGEALAEDTDLAIARHIAQRHGGRIEVRTGGPEMVVKVALPIGVVRATTNA
jgi:two-component system, NtrC family, sensor kinase